MARYQVSTGQLIYVLLTASLGTTLFVESYYLIVGRSSLASWSRRALREVAMAPKGRLASRRLVWLAVALELLAMIALLEQVRRYGLAGAREDLSAHTKTAALASAGTSANSVWAIVADPAVWAAATVAVWPGVSRSKRATVTVGAVVLLLAQLIVYGSRLDLIVSLIGVWIVLYYSGKAVPAKWILATLPIFVILSIPIIAERKGGSTPQLPVVERISRIVGYEILDTALAIHQYPGPLRTDLENATRWLDGEEYLVPGFVWPGRP